MAPLSITLLLFSVAPWKNLKTKTLSTLTTFRSGPTNSFLRGGRSLARGYIEVYKKRSWDHDRKVDDVLDLFAQKSQIEMMWTTSARDHYALSTAVCLTIKPDGGIDSMMKSVGRYWKYVFGDPVKKFNEEEFAIAKSELEWFVAEITKSRERYGINQRW